MSTTESGIPVEALYSPASTTLDYAGIADPGTFPFTRGNFASGYRHKLWTFRQYSGFGTAAETNARYKYLLANGGTGLSVAADLPTQIGDDSDDPDVTEEVGRVGVALDTLADAASKMHFEEIGSLAVLRQGHFAGIITERDLVRAIADGVDTASTAVAGYMTEDPILANPEDGTQEAAARMVVLGIRHLPVVVGSEVVGMISIRDLLEEAALAER